MIFFFPLFEIANFVPNISRWDFPKLKQEQHQRDVVRLLKYESAQLHTDVAHFLISDTAQHQCCAVSYLKKSATSL